MIINVCASSVNRDPTKRYSGYYYATGSAPKSKKSPTKQKAQLPNNTDKSSSIKTKAKKLLQKLRHLIVNKFGKTF
ncbi:hypothetical protein Q1695_002109 [Nippostrongylus brasiliensis]|nr:hypothetical protein Q1695_002109 [Nippostrongylus brasiliensis]